VTLILARDAKPVPVRVTVLPVAPFTGVKVRLETTLKLDVAELLLASVAVTT